MFLVEGKPMKTWNVHVGCRFDCTFCNARKLALGRLKNVPRYRDGFEPHLVKEELVKRFQPGDFVFVSYMGDISFAPRCLVILLLGIIDEQPGVNFLFCTKDPDCYHRWRLEFPDNLYLGATIESNLDYGLSQAPEPTYRYVAMKALEHPHKFISIEPVMDFHLAIFVQWIRDIKPAIIEIGPDNYHNNLREPGTGKVNFFLDQLRKVCPNVIEKKGLERLKGDR